jgi:DNA polymerase III epsilon subunit-like protein
LRSINTLDIEASGINPASYPIEVGIVLASGEAYCSLIQPAASWTHWDKEAEKIHGISLEEVQQHGKTPLEVAKQLNTLLEDTTVYSDCWGLDNPWLIELFHQASIKCRFNLTDIMYAMDEKEYEALADTKQRLSAELNLSRHRATNDARLLKLAYEKIKT